MRHDRISDCGRRLVIALRLFIFAKKMCEVCRGGKRTVFYSQSIGSNAVFLLPEVVARIGQAIFYLNIAFEKIRASFNKSAVNAFNKFKVFGEPIVPPERDEHNSGFVLLNRKFRFTAAQPRVPGGPERF